MPSVSNKQIPKSFRANRPKLLQWLGRTVLSIFGWKVKGGIEHEYDNKKLVILIAPHTSNWDGIFGVAAVAGLDARITFIGKHTAFKYGLGAFLRYMGGIPVDRSKPGGVIQHAIDQIKGIESSLIAISPEGTRSKVKEWKTGFLRIAKEINAQIVPASLDFSKKEILLGRVFKLSGDNKKDILDLKKYYSVFKPKHPEKY
ncbi:MAG: acyltransferase [Gammaproteobacteria bacterium]|nr:acyltransferase [Gammaproteobacteria bacterium]|tara:strand:+ start:2365 stop:2967 length:603 start_codon:yes stop_codon:yes gene_type:complete